VPLVQDFDGFLALVVDVQPTWRLGNEPGEDGDETGEDHLKVDRDLPAGRANEGDSATDGTGGEDGASEPESVAVGGEKSSPRWVSSFDNVDRPGGRDDRDTKTKEETTALDLVNTFS
jgi:hypothetical protein